MKSLTIWALFAALLSQQLFASVVSIRFEDEKTYYSPPSGGHRGYTPTPNCGSLRYDPTPSTPSHAPTPHTPPHHTPPCNCGTPPHDPSTPSHTSTSVEATNSEVCSIPCSQRYGTFECFHDCFLEDFKDGNCVNGRCCCTK